MRVVVWAEWWNLRKDEFHNSYSTQNFTGVTKREGWYERGNDMYVGEENYIEDFDGKAGENEATWKD